jgi:ParB/RepB/Spo0J family partition protein
VVNPQDGVDGTDDTPPHNPFDDLKKVRERLEKIFGDSEQPQDSNSITDKARDWAAGRHSRFDAFKRPKGDTPAQVETELNSKICMIDIASIVPDRNFSNLRLSLDDDYEGGRLKDLMESMRSSGLHTPVIVVARENVFHVRAGFRRTECARRLGWKQILAAVLPETTTKIEEHWTNIIENSARKNLSSYEIAMMAKFMRDRFQISATEFSIKAGFSEKHIKNLLKIVDKLPEEVIDYWKRNGRPSIPQLLTLLPLSPVDAVRHLRKWVGLSPTDLLRDLPKGQKPSGKPGSAANLYRMQCLLMAFESAPGLDQKTRDLCVRTIEFCMAIKSKVPGIYEPGSTKRRAEAALRARRERELHMPELPSLDDDDDRNYELTFPEDEVKS